MELGWEWKKELELGVGLLWAAELFRRIGIGPKVG